MNVNLVIHHLIRNNMTFQSHYLFYFINIKLQNQYQIKKK